MAAAGAEPVRRGRPTITHDNTRVQAFVCNFHSPHALAEAMPGVDDTLTGITYLQTEGQASTRPLSKRMVFRALQRCALVSTESVAAALGRDYSKAAAARYTASTRVASKAIARLLDQFPEWEAQAANLKAERTQYDDLELISPI